MRTNFGMPYVRLDEQKGHFGPLWVRLEFVLFVAFSSFASFFGSFAGRFRAVFRLNMRPKCLVWAI
jgi:hypothetical protein